MNIPKTMRRKGFHELKIGGGLKKPKLIGNMKPIKMPKIPKLKLPKLPKI